jgi:hypothetical protein
MIGVNRWEFSIEGTQPILMHRFNGIDEEKRLKELSDTEQAEAHAYRDGDRKLAIPAEWVRGCLIDVFILRAANKEKQKTKVRVSPRIRITPPLLTLELDDYEIDKRSAPAGNVSRGGARDICVRPLIPQWKTTGVLSSSLDENREMRKWFEDAGIEVGIGSNRINGYGRFKVTSFKEVTA